MVVLEGGGMLTSSGNQYLQPDYLSPLPTTLDAKKSPLALLAQTCSQIGADSPSSKPLISTLDKPKKQSNSSEILPRTSPGSIKLDSASTKTTTRSSPIVDQNKTVAFKPYENNVTKKSNSVDDNSSLIVRPASKTNSVTDLTSETGKKTPAQCKSVSPSAINNNGQSVSTTPVPTPNDTTKTTSSDNRKSVSPSNSSARGASPIIRSGLEILQGHPKDLPLGTYKPTGLLSSGLCCPPGLEHAAVAAANPAFRPPFAGANPFSHHHAAALLAAGYPPPTGSTPYLSYARVKTPSGGEALVPVCKDPYCTGCQFSMHNQQLMMSAAAQCPSGCTQCDHQKYGLAMAMSSLIPPPPPPGTLSAASLPYTQLGSPYVCNWIAGESYCGKRFRTSDELLQHLRTHTNGANTSTSDGAQSAAVAAASSAALLNPLFSTAALHRAAAAAAAAGYPNPPLSPLSSRYHPYAKPPTGMPSSLGASPYSAFNPTPLSPYYSPYSLYSQRLGAAVHP